MVFTLPFERKLAQAAEYVTVSGVLARGFAAGQKFDGTARSSSPPLARAAGCSCGPGRIHSKTDSQTWWRLRHRSRSAAL
ncbi:hypothetical protein ACIGXG_33540 [Streptomyces goshikiensis]|uniref:hypothetical protein n=1 Tax=Streptomyces goshikiensis TaxID=1942 RepID=UPI0037D0CE18